MKEENAARATRKPPSNLDALSAALKEEGWFTHTAHLAGRVEQINLALRNASITSNPFGVQAQASAYECAQAHGLYEGLLRRSKPQLEAAKVTDLVQLLDNIAYAGDEVVVDFDGLSKRLRGTENDYFALRNLQNLESAYVCPLYRKGDPDRGIALQKVHEQSGKLRASIASTAECWKKTGHLFRYELASNLPMLRGHEWVLCAELFVFPDRQDSQRYTLHADLPAIVTNARWHLARFGQLLESLEDTMKQIEFGFESGESNETVRSIMILFISFRFSLLHTPSVPNSIP
ncbi:hypothetical protein GGX14DRAFT_674013 [Mycena pura]|uniref:Uncharacterized protein n=1 Tax=Mycena pura TaxID=153505 RepID=A0AAD6V045_9AGAR|nr:hypothetical protein GGX14DRAFT_674013 [Mycena pura]